MVNSKSGSIRRTLGPRKKRLSDLLVRATPLIQEVLVDEDAKHTLIAEIETNISKLTTAITILQETDKQWQDLIQSLPEDEVADEENLYESVAIANDGYINLLDDARESLGLLRLQMERLQSKSMPIQGQQNDIPASPTNPNVSLVSAKQSRKSAKLPKLTLPMFAGDPMTWDQFYCIFKTNVDESELEGAEKMTYLRGQLHGSALETIEGLQISDEGYALAIDLLKQRFERTPEQMVSSLYSQLKRLPKSSSRIEDLRKTYDACEKIFRQLRSVGEDVDSNRSLTMDVWSKYPVSIVVELSRRKEASTHSKLFDVQKALKDFIDESDELRDMIGDLEPFGTKDASGSKSSNDKGPAFTRNQSRLYPGPGDMQSNGFAPMNSALVAADKPRTATSTSGYAAKPKFPCCFCKEIHFNSECPHYPTQQQRMARLVEVNRCRRCLGNRHSTSDCDAGNDRVRCYYCKTNGQHISALCPCQFSDSNVKGYPVESTTSIHPSNAAKESSSNQASKKPDGSSTTSCGLSVDERSLLSTAVATITNPHSGQQQRAKIIMDSGSHRSYITKSLSDRLGLSPSRKETLSVAVFGSHRSLSVTSGEVQIGITLKNGDSVPLTVHTTPLITRCSLSLDVLPSTIKQFMSPIKDALADDGSVDGPPDILIGSDYFWEFVSGNIMKTDDGIFVIPSLFGLVLGGRFRGDCGTQQVEQPTLLCLTERAAPIAHDKGLALISTESRSQPMSCPDIDEFWSLEKIGISENPADNDDELALKKFNDTVYLQGGRYFVHWPWKEDRFVLPSNYNLALGRLRSLSKRLADSNQQLAEEYNNVIRTQVALGIIEEVPEDEMKSTNSLVHYLPHHAVVRSEKATTKVRIVYDASAKCRKDQSSLNECLYRGPVLLPDLCSILIRFRTYRVAITSDIEKAFLQIGLAPSQRDVTRFLWFNNSTNPDANDISVFRFARVPFGVVSSPFLLGATVKFHLRAIGTEVANSIDDSIYVDNVISGAADDELAKRYYDEAKDIFKTASMNLRQWNTNSSELRDYIPSEDRELKKITSVLGLKWNTEADTLQINDVWTNYAPCKTKREVLKAVASIYDPLGFFQPCTLRLKLFLRDLWDSKSEWDETINPGFQQQWTILHDEMCRLFDFKLPRHIPAATVSTLVVFSDASASAFAFAAYLRTPSNPSQTRWESHIVFSKSRLAPKVTSSKKTEVSIPKLELLGLTIAARATEFIRRSLSEPLLKSYLFCDSICTLRWLQSVKPLPVFVSNRIREIKTLKNVEFRHVDSSDNPADLCSRGTTGQELSESRLWWHGPSWLQENDDTWRTKSNFEALSDKDIDKMVPTVSQPVFHSLVAGEVANIRQQDNDVTFLRITPNKYSTFRKLVRITCWVRRFLKAMVFDRLKPDDRIRHDRIKSWFDGVSSKSFLTSVELHRARKLWIEQIQHGSFEDVFLSMRNNKPHHLRSQLNLQVHDDGLLHSHSRMAFAELPDDAKFPILLPRDDFVTKMIINEVHQNLLHPGVNHTLSQIRRLYWIPQGRNVVKKVINKCQFCRKSKGHPFALPDMPPWPKERVSKAAPFQFTGVDYFGPINVAVNDNAEKMWVCLFTCLTVRAVHLEPVSDCTAEAFMNAISRFISRRGAPEQIISDNAPQFRLAKTLFDRSWHKVFADDAVQSYISDKGVRWVFITELAPWMGGAYERMVGLVKNTYKQSVGRKLLKYEEFQTLLVEIESMVNSRPITYVYSDASSGFPLRPIDFLADRPTGTPEIDRSLRPEGGDASKNLVRYWKSKQRRLDTIWKQWYSDYLLSLRERGSRAHKCGRSDISLSPKAGEIVTVKNDDCPRGIWKIARITKVITGADGSVRSAELMLPNKHLIRRPINHLYRLEIPSTLDETEVNDSANSSNADDFPKSFASTADDEPFEGFTEEEVESTQSRVVSLIASMSSGEGGYLPGNIASQLFHGLSGPTSRVSFMKM